MLKLDVVNTRKVPRKSCQYKEYSLDLAVWCSTPARGKRFFNRSYRIVLQ